MFPYGNTNCVEVETAAVSSVCVRRVPCPIAACLLIDDGPWLILLRQNTCPEQWHVDLIQLSKYGNMEMLLILAKVVNDILKYLGIFIDGLF